jgi:hypothetical protein
VAPARVHPGAGSFRTASGYWGIGAPHIGGNSQRQVLSTVQALAVAFHDTMPSGAWWWWTPWGGCSLLSGDGVGSGHSIVPVATRAGISQ